MVQTSVLWHSNNVSTSAEGLDGLVAKAVVLSFSSVANLKETDDSYRTLPQKYSRKHKFACSVYYIHILGKQSIMKIQSKI